MHKSICCVIIVFCFGALPALGDEGNTEITIEDGTYVQNGNCDGSCEEGCSCGGCETGRRKLLRRRGDCNDPCSPDPWDCEINPCDHGILKRWINRNTVCGVDHDWFNNCDDNDWCEFGSACGDCYGVGLRCFGLGCGDGYSACNIGPKTIFNWRLNSCQSGCDSTECDSGSDYFGNAGGPDDTIITDRPDFTEASSVVGYGVLQVESGYRYTFDNDGTNQVIRNTYPDMLIRYGVFRDWMELRVGWSYSHERTNGVENSGSEDLLVGFKYALAEQQGILPELAAISHVRVPTGGRGFSNNEVLPGAVLLYTWELNDSLSVAMNSGVNQAIDEATFTKYEEFFHSVSVAAAITNRLGAYSEYYTLAPSGADTMVPEHYFDGGFTYLITNDIQWDIYAGLGLNDAADDYFAGSGLSFRLR